MTPTPEPTAVRGCATRRVLALALTGCVLAAACGGGDDAEGASPIPDDTPTAAPSTTPDPPATPTPPPVDEVDEEPDAAPDPADTDVVNADPVLVDLADFMITTATTTYKAGTVNFEVTNDSDIAHEFGIARGASYEELPQLENGSIDEEALGADFLGKTAVVDVVLAPVREISYALEPGQYVLFCNLVVGPVSHAARGQVLSVTVTD